MPQKTAPATHRRIAAYIALHARRRPSFTAILRGDTAVPYAQLHENLQSVMQALDGLAIPPGGLAAVACEDLYTQFLLVFGLESLGFVTSSVRPGEAVECHGLLASADIVFADYQINEPECRRIVSVSPGWLAEILATPGRIVPPPAEAGDGMVVLRSSGTTGAPKRIPLTYRMMNERLARQRDNNPGLGFTRRIRFFAAMHASVGSIYMGAANCLRLGGTFVYRPNAKLADLVGAKATHMTILPYHLRQLLAVAATATGAGGRSGPLLPGLTVQTVGARLPVELRRQALRLLCGRLHETYGANEAGSIGIVDDDGLVTLTRGVTVRIVDAEGAPVPAGETGALQVRGNGLATHYLDDVAATAVMFRDGWFAPGDLAVQTGKALRLVGRRGDVLNLGGIKRPCADLESELLAYPGLRDVALVQPGNSVEPAAVAICIVAGPQFHLPGFLALARRLMDYPIQTRLVPEIPRSPNGKIRRGQLQEILYGAAPGAAAQGQKAAA